MVTFAQAQERADEWINGDVPAYQHREVRVREFELGFVVWGEDRAEGPVSDGGRQRLVIARDSGEATLWPGLPVGEVIRRYEEEYGVAAAAAPAPEPPQRIDLNQTSFLLSPPEWLQEAADKLGIPDRREGQGQGQGQGHGAQAPAAPASPAAPVPSAPSVTPPPAVPAAPVGQASPGSYGGQVAYEPTANDGVPAAVPNVPAGSTPWAGTDTNAHTDDGAVPLPATVFAPPLSGADDDGAPPPVVPADAPTALMSGGSQLPRTAIVPGLGPQGGVPGVPPGAPGGTGAPGIPGAPGAPGAGGAGDIADAATSKAVVPPRGARGGGPSAPPPPGVPGTPGVRPGAPVPPPSGPGAPGAPAGGYLPTQLAPQSGPPGPPGAPGAPGVPQPPGPPGAPGAPVPPPPPGSTPPPGGGMHHAATMLADPSMGGSGPLQPPAPPGPPGAPGAPGGRGVPQPPGPPGVPGAPVPPPPPGSTPPPGGGMHHAATMLADPSMGGLGMGGPGAPQPPGPPGPPGAPGAPVPPPPPGSTPPPGGGMHHAATMLADPSMGGPGMGGPGVPQPPGPPGPPGAPGPVPPNSHTPPPAAYGYPQTPNGQPTVGPGYQAVLRYRGPDGSEQQLIRRSAPGTPHPEWQMLHELRAMNVPPQQVIELHTELESCELPGGYCARMIRETWPQVRITSVAPYGTDHASRQQGMQHLLTHQGELHQVADGPARPAPMRAPLPQMPPAMAAPPEAIAEELLQTFGPQGICRFDQRAVSRQGVPETVARTLVWAGLPADFGPFFWAQPGQPVVPTLAELAAQRQVQPAPDAGSYLVMGSDFGRAICVQYGTANIVAVPVEAGPGGQSVPPQFVNTGLPEFQRSMALLGRMWRLRFGLDPEQAGRWTVDFQAQLVALDAAALASPESWWSVLLEQMWDGLI
ncbi:SUKH-4 family immunity protein [Streptomyces sp. NBC_00893]|uniref:SUKH-4 family immunity protein n=1 Tax=Streptomyces sp. NBC_00893 TaxID=2975862 RepID=UPI0022558134|nr:SUKH-4 family immunity protein [Streptomyces sp. NBC_00893]MCX4847507.1 SUKH-4 family immunity protein [Streptomyces sp. NBC_00893]